MKRTTFIPAIVVILGTSFACPWSVFGQTTASPARVPATTGAISGEVTDHQGAPLAGATVAITNIQTKESTTLKTDVGGNYRAERLAPGEYQVVISCAGFAAKTAKTRVKARHTATVSAHLKPALPATPAPAKPS